MSEGTWTERSGAHRTGTKGGIELKKRTLVITISLISAFILLIAGVITIVVMNLTAFQVELGRIDIMIEGEECNVSAELKFGRDVNVEPLSLHLVLDTGEVPVAYHDKRINAVLNEEQFTEVIEKEYARIEGKVRYDSFFGKRSEREIDTKIDLSFLGEILSSIKVKNSVLSTRFPFTSVVDFNLTAEMSREVNIYAKNTTAQISNGIETREIDLVDLELFSDGSGSGRVEMPTPTLVSMGLWGRNITIVAWGLEADFVFPFTGQ
ncbi:MAG: hypothetical protein ACMUHM_01175 [Thermoplasmatota archaeon]